jgi:hypothetical protein
LRNAAERIVRPSNRRSFDSTSRCARGFALDDSLFVCWIKYSCDLGCESSAPRDDSLSLYLCWIKYSRDEGGSVYLEARARETRSRGSHGRQTAGPSTSPLAVREVSLWMTASVYISAHGREGWCGRQTAGPSTSPLAMREVALRMTASLYLSLLDQSLSRLGCERFRSG